MMQFTCDLCGRVIQRERFEAKLEVTAAYDPDEITSADVWATYTHTINAAANVDGGHDIRRRILALIDSADPRCGFVASIIGRELGLH